MAGKADFDVLGDHLVDSGLMTRHCIGISSTGGGKSNFLNLILKQQMMRGGGALHIDGKNSKEAVLEFLNLARQHDRWHDVRILNIGDDTISNTYNPLLRGDADELSSRIMMLVPEGKDGYFRGQASSAFRAITGVFREMGLPINFRDLTTLMGSETALRWLVENGPKGTEAYHQYKVNLYDQLMEVDRRTGVKVLNEKKMQHTFGDLIGRLRSYCAGSAGAVLNPYAPEIDLLQMMKENLLVYVALPMLAKQEAAVDFAKILVSDFRTAVGQIQNDPIKPFPTFLVLMDEFSSYAMPSLSPLFEQARSANVCLFPFVQTVSSLADQQRGLSKDFMGKIMGNAWNKLSFVLQDTESQEELSKFAGEALKESVSHSYSENISFAGGNDDASVLRTGGRGRGFGRNVSLEYEAIVRPEDFRNLKTGEAIYIGRSEILKLQVPHVKLEITDNKLDFPRFRMPAVEGLSLADKFETKADQDAAAQAAIGATPQGNQGVAGK